MQRLYILTLISVSIAILLALFYNNTPTTKANGEGLVVPKEWLTATKNKITPANDVRPADQTFLTYPEWFLVFSPEEQARYFSRKTASSFPFMSHTAQIWESYAIVNNQIKDIFPTNTGYHFMIWVIGTSATVEYAIKAWYETVIGKLTDTGSTSTDEDIFNARFTQCYVTFIKDRPWYEFNFKEQLEILWKDVPLTGDNMLRKIERRYILSSELIMKYFYGKLIGIGTQTVYGAALPTTAVIIDSLTTEKTPYVISKTYPDKSALIYLPRYDKFNDAITSLVLSGHSFREIAGNDGAILISVIIPENSTVKLENSIVIFEQPIASDNSLKRVAFVVQVTKLHTVLTQLKTIKATTEHIFDY